jgi:hypothetical protein
MIFTESQREYLYSFIYTNSFDLTEGMNDDDIAKSLYSLVKYNDGHWKSEKQAKFLQSRLKHEHTTHIQSWMKGHHYQGKGFLYVSKIPGTGTRDTSKARYMAKLFIWDTGGVSHVIRMKYVHAKKGQQGFYVDWKDKGKETWKRTKEPVVQVDLEKETAIKARANAPMIAKIQEIPNWENNNLLRSFISQLKAGRTLSFKQLNILNRMNPSAEKEDLGQEEWAAQVPRFRKVLGSFMRSHLDDLKAVDIQVAQNWIAHGTREKPKPYIGDDVPHDYKDRDALKTAELGDVEGYYNKKYSKYIRAVKAFENTGAYGPFESIDEWAWIWNGGLRELMDRHGPRGDDRLEYLPGDDPREMFTQITKKAMSKKPTKKSLKYIQFMLQAVKSKGAPGYPVG